MTRSRITKARIVGELARKAGISRKRAAAVLDALSELVYREAENGIIIPGLCKFEVVDRKARRCRDPRTGVPLVIGAHKAVRVKPVKKAKDSIAPMPPGTVQCVDQPSPSLQAEQAPPPQPSPSLQAEQAPPPQPSPPPQTEQAPPPQPSPPPVLFECRHCASEIEVSRDMAGRNVACPWCGAVVTVAVKRPDMSEVTSDSVPDQEAASGAPDEAPFPPGDAGAFVYLRCESCGQEIEASREMCGMSAPCPSCGVTLRIPVPAPAGIPDGDAVGADVAMADMDDMLIEEMKGRTIRIQLPLETPEESPQKKIVFKR